MLFAFPIGDGPHRLYDVLGSRGILFRFAGDIFWHDEIKSGIEDWDRLLI